MLVYHASCTLSFPLYAKAPRLLSRRSFEDVKNDKQEMPKMDMQAPRQCHSCLLLARGKRGNRTRPSGLSQPFLSLTVPCADGHGLEISHTGILRPRCRYAVYANDRYSLLG